MQLQSFDNKAIQAQRNIFMALQIGMVFAQVVLSFSTAVAHQGDLQILWREVLFASGKTDYGSGSSPNFALLTPCIVSIVSVLFCWIVNIRTAFLAAKVIYVESGSVALARRYAWQGYIAATACWVIFSVAGAALTGVDGALLSVDPLLKTAMFNQQAAIIIIAGSRALLMGALSVLFILPFIERAAR